MGYDTKTEVCEHGFRTMVCSSLVESGLWSKDTVERQMRHCPPPKNDTAIIKFCPKISETIMNKVRFAKTQIVNILKLADSGMIVDDICYQNRISNGIY